jgi:DNA primase
MSFDDNKARVLDATDIVALIGRTVALRKVGGRFVGLCPFHSERSPSFSVNPERRFFYCFGCKENGNAIDFVMKRDKIEFVDALDLLAREAGIELVRSKKNAENASIRQQLLDAQSAAQKFFRRMILTPDAKPARQYLSGRGFNDATLDDFRVGFAPDAWDAFLSSGEAKPFSQDMLSQAGLLKKREGSDGFYDTFRGRIMFPIRDESGKPVAFGGRILPGSDNPAKYLNSPETPLFSKGRTIFGLDLAREKIKQTGTAVIVEGYTDVLMAHQFGASNVVSILGTALTENHVNLLRRFGQKIVLLFDGDAAGGGAAERSLDAFLSAPIEIAVATLPEGLDPDEMFLRQGPEAFAKLIDEAVSPLEYFWNADRSKLLAQGGTESDQQAAIDAFLGRMSGLLEQPNADSIKLTAALARLGHKAGIPLDTLLKKRQTLAIRMTGLRRAAGVAGVKRDIPSAREKVETQLLTLVLNHPEFWIRVQSSVQLEDFSTPATARLAEVVWDHFRHVGPTGWDELMASLSEEVKPLALQLLNESIADEPERVLSEAVAYFDAQRDQEAARRALTELRNKPTSVDETELLRKLQDQARKPDPRRATG